MRPHLKKGSRGTFQSQSGFLACAGAWVSSLVLEKQKQRSCRWDSSYSSAHCALPVHSINVLPEGQNEKGVRGRRKGRAEGSWEARKGEDCLCSAATNQKADAMIWASVG